MMNAQPQSEDRKKGGKNTKMPEPRDTPIEIPNAVLVMPAPMIGFIALAPHPAMDVIARTNSVMVMQCTEMLEVFTGYETSNRYVVHDMYLRPLLYCFERSNLVMRNLMGENRNFRMEMLDVYGKPFMQSVRSKACCSCDDSLRTEFQGQLLGLVNRLFWNFQFELFGVGCNEPLIIADSDCLTREFCCLKTVNYPIRTRSGIRLGAISRLFPGLIRNFFTDADTYVVNFPADMPPNLKLMLISAVFLIDFAHFEE